eukprot:COSAG01_NODE_1660_length_9588_cov_458.469175_12_plen_114_part_00
MKIHVGILITFLKGLIEKGQNPSHSLLISPESQGVGGCCFCIPNPLKTLTTPPRDNRRCNPAVGGGEPQPWARRGGVWLLAAGGQQACNGRSLAQRVLPWHQRSKQAPLQCAD